MNRRVSTFDADALLDGRAPRDPELESVGSLLDDLRVEYAATAPPAPRPALVSRLDGHVPLHAVPDPLAPAGDGARRRARRGLRPVAAAAVVGVVAFGGLASAGALPGPIQRVSAEIGSKVGIDLPTPERGTEPSESPSTPTPSAGSRRDDARGDDAPAGNRSDTPSTRKPAASPSVTVPILPPSTSGLPLPLPVPTLPLPTPGATAPAAQPAPPGVPLQLPLDDGLRGVLREVPRLLSRP